MRSSPRLKVFLIAVLVATGAGGKESPATINPELKGAWVVPDGAWDGRTVLLLHGFADDMDGPADIVKHLAEQMAAQGIASLRINFRGEGDKQRTQIESTLATRLEDTAAAHAWLLARPGVKRERVGVLGFSLGATTAIETAGRNPGWWRAMAVWSSPSGDMFDHYLQSETARTALRDGVATEDVPGWKKITTKREFYESFRGIDHDKALAKYPGAFLSVRGSDDMLPQHEAEFMKIASGRRAGAKPEAKIGPAEAVVIAGADHIFHVFQPELGLAARALEVTVAWFVRTL